MSRRKSAEKVRKPQKQIYKLTIPPPSPFTQVIVDMVEARFPKQEEESMYIGMRKVTAAEYKAYEAFQAKTGGLDPLEVNRKKAKEAAQNK